MREDLTTLVSAQLERTVDVADGTAVFEVIHLAEIATKPQGGTTSPAPKM